MAWNLIFFPGKTYLCQVCQFHGAGMLVKFSSKDICLKLVLIFCWDDSLKLGMTMTFNR